jgi:hypothetical protein
VHKTYDQLIGMAIGLITQADSDCDIGTGEVGYEIWLRKVGRAASGALHSAILMFFTHRPRPRMPMPAVRLHPPTSPARGTPPSHRHRAARRYYEGDLAFAAIREFIGTVRTCRRRKERLRRKGRAYSPRRGLAPSYSSASEMRHKGVPATTKLRARSMERDGVTLPIPHRALRQCLPTAIAVRRARRRAGDPRISPAGSSCSLTCERDAPALLAPRPRRRATRRLTRGRADQGEPGLSAQPGPEGMRGRV